MASHPHTQEEIDPLKAWLIRDIWTDEDHLRYSAYADALAEFIQHPSTQAPFVISVQGPWGQGKTSFMRMVQKRLDPQHQDFRAEGERAQRTARLSLSQILEALTDRLASLQPGRPDSPAEERERERECEAPPDPTVCQLLKMLAGRLSFWKRTPSEDTAHLSFRQLRKVLAGHQSSFPDPGPLRTIWFKAWNHQNSEQLWAGLAHCTISQLADRLESPVQQELFWLKLQLDRIEPEKIRKEFHSLILEKFLPYLVVAPILLLAGLGLIYLSIWKFGLFLAAIAPAQVCASWIWAYRRALSEKLKGTFIQFVRQPEYRARMGSLALVQEDVLRALSLLVDRKHPAVIFIDDLDRCSPANVAEVIGAINLFLADHNPYCIFIIGMDAEVVAASMEVAHEKITQKLLERSGELGWSYMDKFVQLPIILPKILDHNQKEYFGYLLDGKEEDNPALPLALTAEQDLGRASSCVALQQLRATMEEMKVSLPEYYPDLSSNPRTLKKIVNLLHFHLLLQQKRPETNRAQSRDILAWVIVLARWPSFVRWLQRLQQDPREEREKGTADRQEIQDTIQKIIDRARMTHTPQAWATELETDGIESGGWRQAPGLWDFLKKHNLQLDRASEHGLW
jgi:hypothetical protein